MLLPGELSLRASRQFLLLFFHCLSTLVKLGFNLLTPFVQVFMFQLSTIVLGVVVLLVASLLHLIAPKLGEEPWFWASGDLTQARWSRPSESSQSATVVGLAQATTPSLSETVVVA
ncbi:hypothetical protein DEO72_LG3g2368 [Vigna unguiculata]|uniref:Uncharacterized protein n=1 Tax=Vigna unguiculata TaxID=3917 RepID=A0A4D6LH31_VIGUN|nr:hypothetical protein DEO72_LG3g2368 [Vigna unguiculata]